MHDFLVITYQRGNDAPSKPNVRAPGSFKIRAKVEMARRDINVTQLAKALGVSRITASQAINHGLHNPTRRRIAEYLGIAA
jgi:hypothetical protein